jgi:dinuclear metal center YbgI/SA1388 family protein
MTIRSIVEVLENLAPPSYQETYDNAGLIIGSLSAECTGVICTLDATEEVILEAKNNGCNMVVAHHPIIFKGLKTITGKNYVEKTIITAIRNEIAIYAIHTNLDNLLTGVNGRMADKLGLKKREVLLPRENHLMKLYVYVPKDHVEKVRSAIFKAGGGKIGNYSECSFNLPGTGTFKAGEGTNPFVGNAGERHEEDEFKVEIIFPGYLRNKIVAAMTESHPYEEVAYDVISLGNYFAEVGSGLIGELPEPIEEKEALQLIKESFNLSAIRHTPLLNKQVKRIALCGGAGSFLINAAKGASADVFITADVKYHEFFDADGRMVIADIGHWESEQFTTDLLFDVLKSNFPTFALRKSEVRTNPVNHFM